MSRSRNPNRELNGYGILCAFPYVLRRCHVNLPMAFKNPSGWPGRDRAVALTRGRNFK